MAAAAASTGSSRNAAIPDTPRVISPSPTLSEGEGYFGPVTRSASKHQPVAAIDEAIEDDVDSDQDSAFENERARTRSRSPVAARRVAKSTRNKQNEPLPEMPSSSSSSSTRKKPVQPISINGVAKSSTSTSNGHLSPSSASSGSYWRDISRSPSPLGLIPIHRHWRSLIHRHEIPRKLLHVSIGFVTLYLYTSHVQPSAITSPLLYALIPIASIDYLRHRFPQLNAAYVRVCGALMRESEVDGWNGVVWYLLGAYISLRAFPKDVAVMSVLLLSWCDTAASTVGRAYGRYTPRLRRGKSLAGSAAAFVVGVGTAAMFWGWMAPRYEVPQMARVDPTNAFMFSSTLRLPATMRAMLGWDDESRGLTSGPLALGVMSLWTGFVGAASEVADLWGIDDNLTIPVLSAVGLWGFLKVFS